MPMLENLLQQWNNLAPDVRSLVIRIGLALLTLVLIWLLRKVLTSLVVAPLRRLVARTSAKWDDILLESIIVPARFLIIALGLTLGAQILQVDVVTNQFVERLVRTFIIIAILMSAYRAVDLLAPSSNNLFRVTGMTINERLLPFFRTAIKILIIAFSVVIIIQEWGYDVSGLVAGLGLGGLAFSLAAKDTVENLFGFTTIVGDQPFVVGDYVKTGNVEGTVEHVGIRSTRIRQVDQALASVPNSSIANTPLINWSRLSKRWMDMTLLISYEATAAQIEQLMGQIKTLLKDRQLVDADSVLVRLYDFTENGMKLVVRCYIHTADWMAYTEEKEAIGLGILRAVEGLDLQLATRSVFLENTGRVTLEMPPVKVPTDKA
jgi:MscS family membrane protein